MAHTPITQEYKKTLENRYRMAPPLDKAAFRAGQLARSEGKPRSPNPYRDNIGGPGITQATAFWCGWDVQDCPDVL